MAFQPNFIPDMTAQTADRYVPFEGSTAGMMNAPDRGGLEDRDQPILGDLESGGRMTAQIDWKAPAEYIADGAGTGAFIDKHEAGWARLIAATEADIAAGSRLHDMKFLSTSPRMNRSDEDLVGKECVSKCKSHEKPCREK